MCIRDRLSTASKDRITISRKTMEENIITTDDLGNEVYEKPTMSIIIAHELIHSWREINGLKLNDNFKGYYLYNDKIYRANAEEIQTIGLDGVVAKYYFGEKNVLYGVDVFKADSMKYT